MTGGLRVDSVARYWSTAKGYRDGLVTQQRHQLVRAGSRPACCGSTPGSRPRANRDETGKSPTFGTRGAQVPSTRSIS
jgi:hypothetical protein